MSAKARVVRLGAWCDVEDVTWQTRAEGRAMRSVTVDVREHAVLADGTRLVLRTGMGWGRTLPSLDDETSTGAHDHWSSLTEDSVRSDTLDAVSPPMTDDDTPPADDHPYDELAELLAGQGVHVSSDDLRALSYQVELGPRLSSHFGRGVPEQSPTS